MHVRLAHEIGGAQAGLAGGRQQAGTATRRARSSRSSMSSARSAPDSSCVQVAQGFGEKQATGRVATGKFKRRSETSCSRPCPLDRAVEEVRNPPPGPDVFRGTRVSLRDDSGEQKTIASSGVNAGQLRLSAGRRRPPARDRSRPSLRKRPRNPQRRGAGRIWRPGRSSGKLHGSPACIQVW